MTDLATTLRLLPRKVGMYHYQFATAIGVDPTQWSKYINGHRIPNPLVLWSAGRECKLDRSEINQLFALQGWALVDKCRGKKKGQKPRD